MSGKVEEMYSSRNVARSIALERIKYPYIEYIHKNIPSIKDIHFTIPLAQPSVKDHITVVFDDDSRIHWYYKSNKNFTLPEKFTKYNNVARTYFTTNAGPNTNISYIKIIRDYIFEIILANSKLFGDIRDDWLPDYQGDKLPYLSKEDLYEHGTNDPDRERDSDSSIDDRRDRRGRGDRDGGKKFTRKSNKRKSNKRK